MGRRLLMVFRRPEIPTRSSVRIATADGAPARTVDERRDEIHVFLPGSHEDLVLDDPGR